MKTLYGKEQIVEIKLIVKVVGGTGNLLILFELFKFGEKSFNELKRMTDLSPVTLSKKLTFLKSVGLVKSRRYGIENRYFVTEKSEGFKTLIKGVEDLIENK